MNVLCAGSGTCIGFNPFQDHLLLVGSESGHVYKCSTAYTKHFLSITKVWRMAKRVDFTLSSVLSFFPFFFTLVRLLSLLRELVHTYYVHMYSTGSLRGTEPFPIHTHCTCA